MRGVGVSEAMRAGWCEERGGTFNVELSTSNVQGGKWRGGFGDSDGSRAAWGKRQRGFRIPGGVSDSDCMSPGFRVSLTESSAQRAEPHCSAFPLAFLWPEPRRLEVLCHSKGEERSTFNFERPVFVSSGLTFHTNFLTGSGAEAQCGHDRVLASGSAANRLGGCSH